MFNGRRQPSRDGTSLMTREYQVRFCERLGVKFPGPTRHFLLLPRCTAAGRFASISRHIHVVPAALSNDLGLEGRALGCRQGLCLHDTSSVAVSFASSVDRDAMTFLASLTSRFSAAIAST